MDNKFSLLVHAGCCRKRFGDDTGVYSSAEDLVATSTSETNAEHLPPHPTAVNKPFSFLRVISVSILRVILLVLIQVAKLNSCRLFG